MVRFERPGGLTSVDFKRNGYRLKEWYEANLGFDDAQHRAGCLDRRAGRRDPTARSTSPE